MNSEKTNGNSNFHKDKRNRVMALCVIILFAAATTFILHQTGAFNTKVPMLTLSSPSDISARSREEIVVDVVVSELPDEIFPAANLSVIFDRKKLEFLGVK